MTDANIIILASITIVAIILLAMKLAQSKELGIIGSIISRIFFLFIIGTVYINGIEGKHGDVFIALCAVFISDSMNAIVHQFTHKKVKKDCEKFVTSMANISAKLTTALNHSLVPFFTISLDGKIEYVNQAFANLVDLPIEVLTGKPLQDVLGLDCSIVSDMLRIERNECTLRINTKSIRAILVGNLTRNGHETITGSIYIL